MHLDGYGILSRAMARRAAPRVGMRVTAIRMGDDLWRLLEREAVLAQAALSANASEPADPAMREPNGEPPAQGESAQSRGRSQRARESARQTRLEAQTERAEKRQSMRRYHG